MSGKNPVRPGTQTDHASRGFENTRSQNRSEQKMGKVEMVASWGLGRQERLNP